MHRLIDICLFEEFLQTLDDKEKDDHYNTERVIAGGVFVKFLKWLDTIEEERTINARLEIVAKN